ncbi:hypothetical protein D6C77_05064 [Aureobasidium pullulans]|nr:hypothetical protein D6C77_05064 [Aureobasidium pullulans]
MSSANSILTRLAEVEAEKHLLQSQLSSVRKNRSPERPKRQTAFLQSSNNVKSPASTLDKVTGWLNNDKPAQRSSHSPLLDFFTQHERYHVVFDNIYQRLEIKDIVALYWLDSGLDIYVRQGAKADTLIRYIGEDKSYEFDHSYGWSDNDQHRTLTKVLIFRRTVPPGSPQIRFHLTRTLPLHSILTDCAFSTAHVNIITWNKAYCMFPNVTFIDRRMYFLHNPDEALGQILSKYSAHGWRTSEWVDYDQTKGCNKPGIRENFRRVGDSSSWVIPLNLHKIRTPESSDSILESCTFQIFPDSGPQKSRHAVTGLKTFSIGAQIFSCCMLKHNYTFHTPDASWSRFLRENLSRMIMLEILKTGDADLIARTRQPDFMLGDHKCCPLLRTRPRFQRPEGWEQDLPDATSLDCHTFEEAAMQCTPNIGSIFATSLASSTRKKYDNKQVAIQDSTTSELEKTATSPQNTKSSRSSQTTTPATSPQKQKGDYFSLIHRRPKASMPPPLNLSPTKLGPLMPDLLTPPPDMPLPDVPSERQPKRSPLHFPSHLPWSPFEKKSRGLPSKSGWISAASLSSSSTGPEKMIPGEMNWI